MGCGRSKHDVASGNTIKHRPNSNADIKKSEAADVIDIVTNSQKFESNKDFDSNKIANVTDVKDITVNAELKEGDIEEVGKKDGGAVGEHETGRLISRDSPNHYFSSRKEGDAIEAIGGEQLIESLHQEANKEGELKEIEKIDGAILEDKGVVDEEEKRAGIENGKPIDSNAEILVNEAKVETVVVTSIDDKKNLDGVEGQLGDSSTKDIETG